MFELANSADRSKSVKSLSVIVWLVILTGCSIFTAPLPKHYPLPLYPGASLPIDGYHEHMGTKSLVLNTSSEPSAVHQFYLDKMKEAGWQITADKQYGQTYSIDAVKDKEKENANVTIQSNAIILTWIRR